MTCSTKTIILVAVVLFLTGFLGDLGAQILARWSPKVELFRNYWSEYGSLRAAIIAGFITLLFGGLMFLLTLALFKKFLLDTRTWLFILFATCIGFVFGVVVDLAANRQDWIPSLRNWYNGMGDVNAALWSGGLTFAFVMFVTSAFWTSSRLPL